MKITEILRKQFLGFRYSACTVLLRYVRSKFECTLCMIFTFINFPIRIRVIDEFSILMFVKIVKSFGI